MSQLSCHASSSAHIQVEWAPCPAGPSVRLATVGALDLKAAKAPGGRAKSEVRCRQHELPQQFVDSADGVRIAVYEEGNPDGPTVVLVHGFPDSHVLWDGVVPLLAERFRIIRYDNRGVGLSSAPKPVSAYTMARFADDFAAVIGELSPGQPVHVLAHDWGSVGMWEYLTRPGASDRVASFTSVSGPSQDQTGRLHLQRAAPAVAPATVRAVDQPGPAVQLHGAVLDTACWRRCSCGWRCRSRRCGATRSTTSPSSRSITPPTWPPMPPTR